MKNYYKIIILLTFYTSNYYCSFAQNNNFVGMYYSTHRSPEGSPRLFVLEDNIFIITYFGGIQYGKWQVLENKTCKFTPQYPKENFTVHGRYEPKLKDKVRIYFENCDKHSTYLALDTNNQTPPILKRVFNKNANCTSWPFVHTQKNEIPNALILRTYTNPIDTLKYQTTSFLNTQKYNDFVVKQYDIANKKDVSFYATIKKNQLYFQEHWSDKKPLSLLKTEDLEFFNEIKKMIDAPQPNYLYYNASYKEFYDKPNADGNSVVIDSLNYKFNKQYNALINVFYTLNDLKKPFHDPYQDHRLVNKFELMQTTINSKKEFRQDEKSIFYYACP